MKKIQGLFALLLVAYLPAALHAGTPLICHPYNIGSAKSLPGGDWRGVDPKYDRVHLVEDTIARLTPDVPVIVRMETLRRAVIYATGNLRGWDGGSYTGEDREIAHALLDSLRERTQVATEKNRDVALFDLGFFAETMRQTNLDLAFDGYPLLVRVAEMRPRDPDVQFALALASSYPERKPGYEAHLAQARNGARPGTLLAANLQSHFVNR